MKYKVIITGSTGMVGRGVLLECLSSDLIEEAPVSYTHLRAHET